MSKHNRIPQPPKAKSGTDLVPVDIPKGRKPVIGITYFDATHNTYGLKNLAKCQKGNRDIYKELHEFLKTVAKMSTIDEVVKKFHSNHKTKNTDKYSRQAIDSIKKKFNVEVGEMIHLHCKGNGKGEFVLHGFILYNIFEIVWMDPNHEHYKMH